MSAVAHTSLSTRPTRHEITTPEHRRTLKSMRHKDHCRRDRAPLLRRYRDHTLLICRRCRVRTVQMSADEIAASKLIMHRRPGCSQLFPPKIGYVYGAGRCFICQECRRAAPIPPLSELIVAEERASTKRIPQRAA